MALYSFQIEDLPDFSLLINISRESIVGYYFDRWSMMMIKI
jgi:hypothetical protein